MSWYNPISWIGSSDGKSQDQLQAESDAADAKRAELNAKAAEKYGQEWYQKTLVNDGLSKVDVAGTIADEFTPKALTDNLAASTSSLGGFVRDVLEPILTLPFRVIPPIGWFILIGGAFFYFGGHVWLRNQISKRIS